MAALRNAYEYTRNAVREPYITASVSLGLLMAELGPRSAMVVHADDPLAKQMELALPSALPTPEMTGSRPVDTALHIGLTGASLEIARRTSSRRELLTSAVGAQALACAAGAGVERSGWLNSTERAQEDVGFSSIFTAWFTKYLFDRWSQAKTPREKLRYVGGMAAGAGAIVGLALMDSKGAKLDLTAHFSGAFTGWAAHMRGGARQEVKQARLLTDNAAA